MRVRIWRDCRGRRDSGKGAPGGVCVQLECWGGEPPGARCREGTEESRAGGRSPVSNRVGRGKEGWRRFRFAHVALPVVLKED